MSKDLRGRRRVGEEEGGRVYFKKKLISGGHRS